MAQVRVVQIGTAQPGTNIQIGKAGALLALQINQPLQGVPAAANIQLGKFNNQTGTFYKDPTGALAAGPIQVGTHLANKTLGYIVGTGAPTVSAIATQTATGAGYFSIWNAGAVQGGFQIQVPNCGQQAKAQGSISNQPAVNQPLNQKNQPLVNQNQPLSSVNQPLRSVNQPLVQQNQPLNQVNQPLSFTYYPANYQAPNYYGGAYYPGFYTPPNFDFFIGFRPGNYYPPVYFPPNYYGGAYYPASTGPPAYPAVQQNQPLNQKNQPLVNQNQPLVNQNQPLSSVNQPLNQQNQPLVNQPLIQTPATNQAAVGTLYNGSWVNTAPGTVQNATGFTVSIPAIGTLTTQGGAFSGTGGGGFFQGAAPTYTRTASAAFAVQQGIVNFQATTRN
jgi:hypothetical protein